MRASALGSRRASAWLLAGLAVVLAVAVVAFWRPWSAPAATVAPRSGDAAAPALLDLPANPTVLIFGDSWTFGSAASDPALGYAYVVSEFTGWTTVVDGVRGSGYLRSGVDGPDYGARIAALDPALHPDLIIIQGSINDRFLPAADYPAAVNAAWDRLTATYPSARVVILGPAPAVLPTETTVTRIDRVLSALAGQRGWWYISPVREEWITPADYLDVIDTGAGRFHPSTAGHRYLAERLAEAVAAITR